MSDQDFDAVDPQQELESLKSRADLMGVKYHPSISLEKLRAKVNAAIESEDAPEEDEAPAVAVAAAPKKVIDRAEAMRKAQELVRVRVTCMNPAKKEWEGEIFTVGNNLVGTLKKFVPFNAEEGWHVPRMILDMIQSRECQIFTSTKDSKGNTIRKGKLIKEFAVEILPPLTEAELKDLAQRQAMAKSVD